LSRVSFRGGSVLAAVTVLLAASAAAAFDLQGHRGARGLAPENTLAGFAKALAVGVTTLELDLAMTRDGILVVHHDLRLNPDTTRGLKGEHLSEAGPPIRSLALGDLARYDVGRLKPGSPYATTFREQQATDGERIPTLEEVFQLARRSGARHVGFNIETKLAPASGPDAPDPDTFARAVASAVRESGLAERVTVQSFDWRTLHVLKEIAPEIRRSCLTSGSSFAMRGTDDGHTGSVPQLVAAAGCAVWSPAFRDLTVEALAQAKGLGLQVIPWTVNQAADMERLIDWGVDGLITDYPDRLRKVMAAKGLALPPSVTVR
jgi:glycerophosphoryl diester phosphodiesterase